MSVRDEPTDEITEAEAAEADEVTETDPADEDFTEDDALRATKEALGAQDQ